MRADVLILLVATACRPEQEAQPTAPPPAPQPRLPSQPNDACQTAGILLPGGGECTCTPPIATGARVWGTGQYTDDSAICTAALHAGVIDDRGGRVRIELAPPCTAYAGSTRNNVTTAGYGAWGRGFIFPGTAFAGCDQALRGGPQLERLIDASVRSMGACPIVLPIVADGTEERTRCTCSSPVPSGPIWGTGPYTLDSSPCAAAVHAGQIGASGGEVELRIVAGCSRYEGGAANGVTSHAAERTDHAFIIGGGAAACPAPRVAP